jgi:hypothetical protein
MFVVNTQIPNLKLLRYQSEREAAEEEENISSFASSYRTLTSVKLIAKFESSVSLLNVVERCRNIERLIFSRRGIHLVLDRSDILAVASLPRLKYLDIGNCRIADDAASAFVRCRGLKELRVDHLVDPAILGTIGENLVSLDLWSPSKEVVDLIVEYCPNLQYLILGLEDEEWEEDELEQSKLSLKSGLKNLAKLKVNGKSVRLGTDWEGYPK